MKNQGWREIAYKNSAREFLAERIPFCLIRFPNEKKPELYHRPLPTPANPDLHLAVSGWDPDKPDYYYYEPFQPETKDLSKNQSVISSAQEPNETAFKEYQAHFEKYQAAFTKGILKKAILSRIKNVTIAKNFDAINYFEKLENAYPTALVYILLHPGEGLWIGASPEILLRYTDHFYHTISLAGTQSKSAETYKWTEKEIEEQEMVSQHIREQLAVLNSTEIQESKPETIEAGSVAHIRSEFRFRTKNAPANFREIIQKLHPTPAIAGLPVGEAVKIINKTELHARRLYTGTIGRKKGRLIDYYVNLRCMQVFPDSVSLYLGGGITAGSEVKSEWDETEKKAKTLLKWMEI